MSQALKQIEWPNVVTFHDLRSTPDAVPWGRWRMVENVACVEAVWQRRGGWRRHGYWTSFSDYADLRVKPDEATDPIRSLYVHVSPSGHRRLFAGSGSLYSQLHDGRWRTLYTGAVGDRYQFASVGDFVFATNNDAAPRYHPLDSDGFKEIPDLSVIGLTKAGMVASWKGLLFFGDVTMDAVRIGHRIVWSDMNNPLSFDPKTDSVAGFQDLDPGETALAAIPMGDALFIFTTLSIWRVTVVGGEAFLSFQQVYHDRNGVGCLMSRYAIATWQDQAIYLTRDGLRVFSSYSAVPDQPPWMLHATPALDTLDLSRCRDVSMGVRARRGEVWITYPAGAGTTPNRTIVLNLNYQSSDEIDHGFYALLPAVLDESLEVIEWMRTTVGCSSASIDAIFPPTDGEHRPTFDGNSPFLEDFCQQEDAFPTCSPCPTKERFIMVSASDGGLKEYDDAYYARDQYVTDQYVSTGYGCRFTTGALFFNTTNWKRAVEASLGIIPVTTDQPRDINLTVSASGVPGDVLTPNCSLRSYALKPKKIDCPMKAVAETQPNAHLRWQFVVEGRYLFLDFVVPACTGGAFAISRLSLTMGASANSTA